MVSMLSLSGIHPPGDIENDAMDILCPGESRHLYLNSNLYDLAYPPLLAFLESTVFKFTGLLYVSQRLVPEVRIIQCRIMAALRQ